jgi:hypothetical protein
MCDCAPGEERREVEVTVFGSSPVLSPSSLCPVLLIRADASLLLAGKASVSEISIADLP